MLMVTSFFSAKGKKGGDDDEKDASPGGDSIIPTLPDVKMCAAKAIARCARNSQLLLFCSHCFLLSLFCSLSYNVQTTCFQSQTDKT